MCNRMLTEFEVRITDVTKRESMENTTPTKYFEQAMKYACVPPLPQRHIVASQDFGVKNE